MQTTRTRRNISARTRVQSLRSCELLEKTEKVKADSDVKLESLEKTSR